MYINTQWRPETVRKHHEMSIRLFGVVLTVIARPLVVAQTFKVPA
jgi:hypothetical protein